MEKKKLLEEYINKCTVCIETKDENSADKLSKLIINVFFKEIPNITLGVHGYGYIKTSFVEGCKLLREKLVNYLATLKREDNVRAFEIEKLKLQNQSLNISNVATAHSSVDVKIEVKIATNITIILEKISKNEVLEKDAKEELEEMVADIQKNITLKRTDKAKTKIWEFLRYIGDKSLDLTIALLPSIGQISETL